MTEAVLVIDVGSSGLKAVLFDRTGAVRAEAGAVYETQVPAPGRAEQAPADWVRALQEAIQGLPTDVPPGAVTFAGTMENMLALDRDGSPLMPALLYSDARAEEEFANRSAALAAAGAGRIIGNAPDPFMTAFKIDWLRRREPALFDRVAVILPGAKDFLVAELCGVWRTDPTNATTTGLMDIETRDWSSEILGILGIAADLLPQIRPAAEVVGVVSDTAARAFGLPPGIPVINGCGDAGASTVGATGMADDRMHVYLGTTGWVARAVPLDPSVLPRPFFSLAHPAAETVIEVAPILSAGSAPDWYRRLTGTALEAMDRAAAAADRSPPQVMFLPYLAGERAPFMDPAVRAVFLGIDGGDGADALYYAVLEGVALAIRNCMDALGEKPDVLSMIGGGAASPVWPQLIADACGCAVEVSALPTAATAVGAYRVAAAALGLDDHAVVAGHTVMPRPDRAARAETRLAAFRAATDFARSHAVIS